MTTSTSRLDAPIRVAEIDSPVGALTLAVRGDRLCALVFQGRWEKSRAALARRFPGAAFVREPDPAGIVGRLRRYFAGDPTALDAIAVDTGGTTFQRAVWQALRTIPAGHTASYRDIAVRIGAPSAVRAVGAANGANPVALVVPCHRVVGSDGSLTGYAGGLERKRWLLAHEAASAPLGVVASRPAAQRAG